jgi:hypothetical protein
MTDQSDDKKWHYVNHRGVRQGPVREADLRWAAQHGHLIPSSLVWAPGQREWLPAKQVLPSHLFDGVELPPPLPDDPSANAEESEEPASLPASEVVPGNGQQLLFKWLKDFDTNVRVFPARAERAGLKITRHFKPSKSTNIFEGEIKLGSKQTRVQVVLGTKPVLGGIMKMNVLQRSVSTSEFKTLARDSETWFKRYWAGEERIPWMAIAVGVGAVPLIVVSILAFDALGPGRTEAALACRTSLSAYIPIERLDEFDFDRGLFRPIDWNTNQARSMRGQPIKCVVIPKLGAFSYLGACDWIGNASSPPQTEHLSCLVYFDADQRRWAVPTH